VLEAEVTVRIDFSGHHRLTREVDAGGAGRPFHRALSADLREAIVLHDEGGVLDRRATIARDQPCPFVHGRDGGAARSCLALHAPGPSGGDE